MNYKVFLRLEAMEMLRKIRGVQKTRISRFIDALTVNPFLAGDFSENDDAQRQIEIKVIGRYAITYWADHAVSEVKIIDIRMADGP